MSNAHPKIVSPAEWLTARRELLEQEKALTRQGDAVNAQRRRLPMVELKKMYRLEGSKGSVQLNDLFEGRRQLIVYHFMFDPLWEKGCSGCTSFVNALGDLSMLAERDTSFVLISRAPWEKLLAYKQQHGWKRPWYSSFGSDFNYDFHVTIDRSVTAPRYNFREPEEIEARANDEPYFAEGETHGLSVFFRLDDRVYHTYSTYARGVESRCDAYRLLDCTPFGRQEDFEDSPPGWPQRPTYG